MDASEMQDLLRSYLSELDWTNGATKDDLMACLTERDDALRTMVDEYVAEGTYPDAFSVLTVIPAQAWQSTQGDAWRGPTIQYVEDVVTDFKAGPVGEDTSDVSHEGGPRPQTPGFGESAGARGGPTRQTAQAGSGASGGGAGGAGMSGGSDGGSRASGGSGGAGGSGSGGAAGASGGSGSSRSSGAGAQKASASGTQGGASGSPGAAPGSQGAGSGTQGATSGAQGSASGSQGGAQGAQAGGGTGTGAGAPPRGGMPGDGAGRIENTESQHAGVWPASGPLPDDPNARYQPMASFGQGERGAAGYEDSGRSEAMTIPPGDEPTQARQSSGQGEPAGGRGSGGSKAKGGKSKSESGGASRAGGQGAR